MTVILERKNQGKGAEEHLVKKSRFWEGQLFNRVFAASFSFMTITYVELTGYSFILIIAIVY
jgi:hypothetical protein